MNQYANTHFVATWTNLALKSTIPDKDNGYWISFSGRHIRMLWVGHIPNVIFCWMHLKKANVLPFPNKHYVDIKVRCGNDNRQTLYFAGLVLIISSFRHRLLRLPAFIIATSRAVTFCLCPRGPRRRGSLRAASGDRGRWVNATSS